MYHSVLLYPLLASFGSRFHWCQRWARPYRACVRSTSFVRMCLPAGMSALPSRCCISNIVDLSAASYIYVTSFRNQDLHHVAIRCSVTSQDRHLLLQYSPVAAVLNHSTFRCHKVAAWCGMSRDLHSTATSFPSIPPSSVSLPQRRNGGKICKPPVLQRLQQEATRGNQPRCTQHHPVSV